jgi:hypothetical protein
MIDSIIIFSGIKRKNIVGMMRQACNPRTWEAEVRGSQVPGQPAMYSESLSPKKNKPEIEYRLSMCGGLDPTLPLALK